MLLGLVLLETLSIALFAVLLFRFQQLDVRRRATDRVAHQANSLAAQAQEALQQDRLDWVGLSVHIMGEAPSVACARITDPAGKVLYVGKGEPYLFPLEPEEKTQIQKVHGPDPLVFAFGNDRWEGVRAITVNGNLRGYAWIESNKNWDSEQIADMLRGISIFAGVWIIASVLLVALISRAISRPLALLHKGTRALMANPESSDTFPLPVIVNNEFGDLIGAFNGMVSSIQEQRAGLSDTLSILDSMLANAPVGLAFFDRHLRFVRVNQVFANLTEIPLSRQLGRSIAELFPRSVGEPLEQALEAVFDTEGSVREIELSGTTIETGHPFTWLVSVYPIRTTTQQVRWAGIIVRDVSERARAEEALRRTEKLAATGRLAASIAHEINNPLEAITNLLFLLHNFSGLTEPALHYVTMAEHEARRITEIAQQTLRFYRQSTQPIRADIPDLVDSVLELYRGRLTTLAVDVQRRYRPHADLLCFEGEIRQVIANLIGNATDAISPTGGRLLVRVRPSRRWDASATPGIRLTVADTGCGMPPDVRNRIFEAFFTTKDATGTGLGLWVSQEIIVKHQGLVRVRSRVASPGHPSGTVFHIFLPENESLSILPIDATSAAPAQI
ncbi:PAS domain S-box protein [Acidobacteria bacterium AB60]|nr:PAS domain S-box protein [Acidobacteria bacterium AB60]